MDLLSDIFTIRWCAYQLFVSEDHYAKKILTISQKEVYPLKIYGEEKVNSTNSNSAKLIIG